jgi:hypothetical protein
MQSGLFKGIKMNQFRTHFLVAAFASAAAFTGVVSCGPAAPKCSASTCKTGCCSADTCVTTPSASQCGSAGNECKTCSAGNACINSICVVSGNTGGGSATSGGGSATSGGGSATSGGGSATTGGGSAATGGGSATIGGGSATTGGGSATTGGGSATTGGGSATTGGGSATTGGGSATTGGGSATTGGGFATTGGGSAGGSTALDSGCPIVNQFVPAQQLAAFRITPLNDGGIGTSSTVGRGFVPAMPVDYLDMEVWWSFSGQNTGITVPAVIDLAAEGGYVTCNFCMLYCKSLPPDGGDCAVDMYANQGTFNVSSATRADAGTFNATLTNAVFRQWDFTNDAPVPGGACLQVNSATINTPF